MAKSVSGKVFVKYIQQPGMVERVIIGPHPGQCFYADPKMQDADLGDLVDVEFLVKWRPQFEEAGFLIFDEKGMQRSVQQISDKELRKLARQAAKSGSDAAQRVGESVSQKSIVDRSGSGVPTPEEYFESYPEHKKEDYERRFFGLRPGDEYNEITVVQNLVKAGKATEKEIGWLEEAKKSHPDLFE